MFQYVEHYFFSVLISNFFFSSFSFNHSWCICCNRLSACMCSSNSSIFNHSLGWSQVSYTPRYTIHKSSERAFRQIIVVKIRIIITIRTTTMLRLIIMFNSSEEDDDDDTISFYTLQQKKNFVVFL